MSANMIEQSGARASGGRAMLEHAARMAGIGVWSCDLATNALDWTDGVYDLFGLPPRSPLSRTDTVRLYAEESVAEMERLRARAIATASPFSMKARIVRPDGTHRWMRLTAQVECRGGKVAQLFGIKRDISDEDLSRGLSGDDADRDRLTGLAGQGHFQRQFLYHGEGMADLYPIGGLVLIDIDLPCSVAQDDADEDAAACLREVSRRMETSFRDAPMIARIDRHRFAIVTTAGHLALSVQTQAQAFINSLAAPVTHRRQPVRITASVGAALTDDADLPDGQALFDHALGALVAARQAGHNRLRMVQNV